MSTLTDFNSKEYYLPNASKDYFVTDVDLTGANLTDADLTGANLFGANLTDADLTGAILKSVKSGNISGEPTLPEGYKLINSYIVGLEVDLTGANLTDADLTGVNLTDANLTDANLTGVKSGNISGALTELTLPEGYKLKNGYIVGPRVDLTDAYLTGTDLTDVDLTGANLTGVKSGNIVGSLITLPQYYKLIKGYIVGPDVDLTEADLTDADFTGVDLTGANLTQVISRRIYFDENDPIPILPQYYKLIGGYIVGPNVNLLGANLMNLDLTDADLSGATLLNANLFNATLTGVKSGNIEGTPKLLEEYKLINGYIVGPGVNLTGANLTGANLTDAILTGANLSEANLTDAILTCVKSGNIEGTPILSEEYKLIDGYIVGPDVNLTGVDLTGADLTGVDLTGAKLTNIILNNTNLTNVTITGPNLTGIIARHIFARNLTLPNQYKLIYGIIVGPGANLSGVNLTGADLTGINLEGANLSGTDLTDVILTGVISGIEGEPKTLPKDYVLKVTEDDGIYKNGYIVGPGVNLTGADLTGADLTGIDLSGADLTDSILTGVKSGNISGEPTLPEGYKLKNMYIVGPGVDLTGANLTGADLIGVDLTGVNLTGAILKSVKSGNISGEPTLPQDYKLKNSYIVGPDVDLTGADLTGADLTDVDLTDANLIDVKSGNISGEPTLPEGYKLIKSYIVGPGVNLTGADLTGADLTGADLTRVKSGNISGEPNLPTGYKLKDRYILGPHVDLTDATLSGELTKIDLTGSILTNSTLSGNLSSSILFDTTLTNTIFADGIILTGVKSGNIHFDENYPPTLPEGYILINGYIVGPGVDLTGADLTGADLTGADLTNTNLTGAVLRDVILTRVDLKTVNLTNVDITQIELSKDNLRDLNINTTIEVSKLYLDENTIITHSFNNLLPGDKIIYELSDTNNTVSKTVNFYGSLNTLDIGKMDPFLSSDATLKISVQIGDDYEEVIIENKNLVIDNRNTKLLCVNIFSNSFLDTDSVIIPTFVNSNNVNYVTYDFISDELNENITKTITDNDFKLEIANLDIIKVNATLKLTVGYTQNNSIHTFSIEYTNININNDTVILNSINLRNNQDIDMDYTITPVFNKSDLITNIKYKFIKETAGADITVSREQKAPNLALTVSHMDNFAYKDAIIQIIVDYDHSGSTKTKIIEYKHININTHITADELDKISDINDELEAERKVEIRNLQQQKNFFKKRLSSFIDLQHVKVELTRQLAMLNRLIDKKASLLDKTTYHFEREYIVHILDTIFDVDTEAYELVKLYEAKRDGTWDTIKAQIKIDLYWDHIPEATSTLEQDIISDSLDYVTELLTMDLTKYQNFNKQNSRSSKLLWSYFYYIHLNEFINSRTEMEQYINTQYEFKKSYQVGLDFLNYEYNYTNASYLINLNMDANMNKLNTEFNFSDSSNDLFASYVDSWLNPTSRNSLVDLYVFNKRQELFKKITDLNKFNNRSTLALNSYTQIKDGLEIDGLTHILQLSEKLVLRELQKYFLIKHETHNSIQRLIQRLTKETVPPSTWSRENMYRCLDTINSELIYDILFEIYGENKNKDKFLEAVMANDDEPLKIFIKLVYLKDEVQYNSDIWNSLCDTEIKEIQKNVLHKITGTKEGKDATVIKKHLIIENGSVEYVDGEITKTGYITEYDDNEKILTMSFTDGEVTGTIDELKDKIKILDYSVYGPKLIQKTKNGLKQWVKSDDNNNKIFSATKPFGTYTEKKIQDTNEDGELLWINGAGEVAASHQKPLSKITHYINRPRGPITLYYKSVENNATTYDTSYRKVTKEEWDHIASSDDIEIWNPYNEPWNADKVYVVSKVKEIPIKWRVGVDERIGEGIYDIDTDQRVDNFVVKSVKKPAGLYKPKYRTDKLKTWTKSEIKITNLQPEGTLPMYVQVSTEVQRASVELSLTHIYSEVVQDTNEDGVLLWRNTNGNIVVASSSDPSNTNGFLNMVAKTIKLIRANISLELIIDMVKVIVEINTETINDSYINIDGETTDVENAVYKQKTRGMSLSDIGDKIVNKIKDMLPTFNATIFDVIDETGALVKKLKIEGQETGANFAVNVIDNDSKSFFSLDSAITSVNGDTGTLGWIKNGQIVYSDIKPLDYSPYYKQEVDENGKEVWISTDGVETTTKEEDKSYTPKYEQATDSQGVKKWYYSDVLSETAPQGDYEADMEQAVNEYEIPIWINDNGNELEQDDQPTYNLLGSFETVENIKVTRSGKLTEYERFGNFDASVHLHTHSNQMYEVINRHYLRPRGIALYNRHIVPFTKSVEDKIYEDFIKIAEKPYKMVNGEQTGFGFINARSINIESLFELDVDTGKYIKTEKFRKWEQLGLYKQWVSYEQSMSKFEELNAKLDDVNPENTDECIELFEDLKYSRWHYEISKNLIQETQDGTNVWIDESGNEIISEQKPNDDYEPKMKPSWKILELNVTGLPSYAKKFTILPLPDSDNYLSESSTNRCTYPGCAAKWVIKQSDEVDLTDYCTYKLPDDFFDGRNFHDAPRYTDSIGSYMFDLDLSYDNILCKNIGTVDTMNTLIKNHINEKIDKFTPDVKLLANITDDNKEKTYTDLLNKFCSKLSERLPDKYFTPDTETRRLIEVEYNKSLLIKDLNKFRTSTSLDKAPVTEYESKIETDLETEVLKKVFKVLKQKIDSKYKVINKFKDFVNTAHTEFSKNSEYSNKVNSAYKIFNTKVPETLALSDGGQYKISFFTGAYTIQKLFNEIDSDDDIFLLDPESPTIDDINRKFQRDITVSIMYYIEDEKNKIWKHKPKVADNFDEMFSKTIKDILCQIIDERSTYTANIIIDVILKLAFKWTVQTEIINTKEKYDTTILDEYLEAVEKQEEIQKAFEECGRFAKGRLEEIGTTVRDPEKDRDKFPLNKFFDGLTKSKYIKLQEQMAIINTQADAKKYGYTNQQIIKEANKLRQDDVITAWNIEARYQLEQRKIQPARDYNVNFAHLATDYDINNLMTVSYTKKYVEQLEKEVNIPTLGPYNKIYNRYWYEIKSYNKYKERFNKLSDVERYEIFNEYNLEKKWINRIKINNPIIKRVESGSSYYESQSYMSFEEAERKFYRAASFAISYRSQFMEQMEGDTRKFNGNTVGYMENIFNDEAEKNGEFQGIQPLAVYAAQFIKNHENDTQAKIQARKVAIKQAEVEEMNRVKNNYRKYYLGAKESQDFDSFMNTYIEAIQNADAIKISGKLYKPNSLRVANENKKYSFIISGPNNSNLFTPSGNVNTDIKFVLHYVSHLGTETLVDLPRDKLKLDFKSKEAITVREYLDGRSSKLTTITLMSMVIENLEFNIDGETKTINMSHVPGNKFTNSIVEDDLTLYPDIIEFKKHEISESIEATNISDFTEAVGDKVTSPNTAAVGSSVVIGKKVADTLLFKDSMHFAKGISVFIEDGPRKHGGNVNDLVSGLTNENAQQLTRFVQQEFWGTGNFPVYLSNLAQGKLGKFTEGASVGAKGIVAAGKAAKASVVAIKSAGSVTAAFKTQLVSIKTALVVKKVWLAKASTASLIKAGSTVLFKSAIALGKLAIAIAVLGVILTAVAALYEFQEREKLRDTCKIKETKVEKGLKQLGESWTTAAEYGGPQGGGGDCCIM